MSEELSMQTRWLARQSGDETERRFFADIALGVGGDWLTRLEDVEASTVRDSFRGCAYRFASWIAANWWRLRHEPLVENFRRNTDWRMAHGIAAAGGGFVWPDIFFASEGDFMSIMTFPSRENSVIERVRYLQNSHHRIGAVEFEKKIDGFMSGILSRFHSEGIDDEFLPNLWEDVMSERRDPEASMWRMFEALCGYDPTEAPDELIARLIARSGSLGSGAVRELAAEGRHEARGLLDSVTELEQATNPPEAGGFCGRFASLKFAPDADDGGKEPWEQAGRFARLLRKSLGIDPESPVSNRNLSELLGTSPEAFTSEVKSTCPISIALKRRDDDKAVNLFFNSRYPANRRFAASRLFGDSFLSQSEDRLLPATKVKNTRQQFQRAFAQELLCPSEALISLMDSDIPDDDRIEEAARHFDVSPLLVKTTLVNKGEMDRSALWWN